MDLRDKYSEPESTKFSDETLVSPGKIEFDTTERFVGFLVYVSQTYTSFVPYLKGIYLTLNSWRPGRNSDGWPLTEYEKDGEGVRVDELTPPALVTMVPRFKSDMKALLSLTQFKEPPKLPVRSQL